MNTGKGKPEIATLANTGQYYCIYSYMRGTYSASGSQQTQTVDMVFTTTHAALAPCQARRVTRKHTPGLCRHRTVYTGTHASQGPSGPWSQSPPRNLAVCGVREPVRPRDPAVCGVREPVPARDPAVGVREPVPARDPAVGVREPVPADAERQMLLIYCLSRLQAS